jgi:ubiquinone/menaquinone biosynthesis C-methylase UbiE
VAPNARLVAAAAEAIPVRSGTAQLMTAAGSLNWVDLTRFFPEARRVLTPGGTLVVYDFSTGRRFRDSDALSQWFEEFETRYPWPPAASITPDTLNPQSYGLRMSDHEYFEIALPIAPEFYVRYMMTETNVTGAIERGIPEEEIRSWCERTLAPVFAGVTREVVFEGFVAYIAATSS